MKERKPKPKIHAGDIELALARHFNYRQNMIVPNVFWGLGFLHEIDLLIVSQAGYATEVEIKVSISDLKADVKKKHQHCSQKIKYFYFAVPETLYPQALEYIPKHAGLFVIKQNPNHFINKVYVVKTPTCNKARKLTEKEILKLGKLAAMRIWSLKKHAYQQQRNHII